MDSAGRGETFQATFNRFKTISNEEKQKIFNERKAQNTNRATNTWMKCFNDYLSEKNLPKESDLPTLDLPEILSDFYCELKRTSLQMCFIRLEMKEK